MDAEIEKIVAKWVGERDALQALVGDYLRRMTLFANGRMDIYSTPPSDDDFNKGLRHAIDDLSRALRDLPTKEESVMATLSYHNVYVTTSKIERTRLSDLPFGYELTVNRVGGWCLWRGDELIAGEYEGSEAWLIIDVDGYVILNGREKRG